MKQLLYINYYILLVEGGVSNLTIMFVPIFILFDGYIIDLGKEPIFFFKYTLQENSNLVTEFSDRK